MKKLKFNGLNFDSLEKLTKVEQKKVVGGYSNGGAGGNCDTKHCNYTTQEPDGNGRMITVPHNNETCTSTTILGKCMYICPGPGSCF